MLGTNQITGMMSGLEMNIKNLEMNAQFVSYSEDTK